MKETLRKADQLKSYLYNLERINPNYQNEVLNKKLTDLTDYVKKESVSCNKKKIKE